MVYNRVLVNATVPVVDKSRSAEVFASLEDRLNTEMPEDAPRWILERYQQLVGDCGAPTTTDTTGTTTGN